MAKPKPIVIDGEFREVDHRATISDLVPDDVAAIVTHDGALIPRKDFAKVPIPQGFETNLSAVNKGGGAHRGGNQCVP